MSEMTIKAAFTASSEPVMVKVNLSNDTSASEFAQISDNIVLVFSGEGRRDVSACWIHQEAL
jgi:hypothetical protein